jgi:hypothetical protein
MKPCHDHWGAAVRLKVLNPVSSTMTPFAPDALRVEGGKLNILALR